MVVFEALVSHHCADFHTATLPHFKERCVDAASVRIVFRQFPGTRKNPYPAVPAIFAGCVDRSCYFEVVEKL